MERAPVGRTRLAPRRRGDARLDGRAEVGGCVGRARRRSGGCPRPRRPLDAAARPGGLAIPWPGAWLRGKRTRAREPEAGAARRPVALPAARGRAREMAAT